MNDINDFERQVAQRIFDELVGLTIDQAKKILKAVHIDLHKHAVIKGDCDA